MFQEVTAKSLLCLYIRSCLNFVKYRLNSQHDSTVKKPHLLPIPHTPNSLQISEFLLFSLISTYTHTEVYIYSNTRCSCKNRMEFAHTVPSCTSILPIHSASAPDYERKYLPCNWPPPTAHNDEEVCDGRRRISNRAKPAGRLGTVKSWLSSSWKTPNIFMQGWANVLVRGLRGHTETIGCTWLGSFTVFTSPQLVYSHTTTLMPFETRIKPRS